MIVTVSGKCFEPDDIFKEPSLVDIEDIAHALSLICRWAGATRYHYSVAQHCMAVAYLFRSDKMRLDAMLHDAAEAYIGDVVRTIKSDDISKLEEALLIGIYNALGLSYGSIDPIIKKADTWIAYREAAHFYPSRMEKACLDVIKEEDLLWLSKKNTWKLFTKRRISSVKRDYLYELKRLLAVAKR